MKMEAFKVWTTNSLDRVRKDRKPQEGTSFSMYAAKGEYESFQIVINAFEEITVNGIEILEFKSADGNTISDNVQIYREHYISFDKNSKHAGVNRKLPQELVGSIPDALIPATHPETGLPLGSNARFYAFPHNMPKGDLQPYFIDVKIPLGVKSGVYTAKYTVFTDKGSFSDNISLTVWKISLPIKQVQKSFFGHWSTPSPAKTLEAAKNRMFVRSSSKEEQELLHEAYGYNTSNIGFWSGADIDNPEKMKAPPTVNEVEEKLKGFSDKIERFAYTADEIGHKKELFPTIIEYAKSLHTAGAKQLVVMPPMKELFDDGLGTGRSAVDIWVVLPKQYYEFKENIDLAIAKGDSLWTYNCLIQDDYSPKWLMDFPLIGHRLQPGFINYSIKAQGFLYWVVDNYMKLEDPWGDITCKPDKYGDIWVQDGRLFYPGEDVGLPNTFVPSLRVKAIRDGFEDYELCAAAAARGKAALAEHYSNIIGKDFKCWTDIPEVLLENRKKLGEAFTLGVNDEA